MNAKPLLSYLTIAALFTGAVLLPVSASAHGPRDGYHDNGHYGAKYGWNHTLRQGRKPKSRIRVLHEHRELPFRVERYFDLERPRIVHRNVRAGSDRELRFTYRNRRD